MFIDRHKKVIIFFIVVIFVFSFYFFKANKKPVATAANPSIKLPIIMYHHILKDQKKWGKYVISPYEFEDDIIYLKKEGYTTIVMQDLIDFVYSKKELPLKPIMLTFDDGYFSNYEYILPILEKHDCRAVISVVGEFIDDSSEKCDSNAAYSYLNWEQIKDLVHSPYIEIQNHSYSMHKLGKRKGASKKKGESYEQYKKALSNDVGKMQILMEEKTGYKPTTFTYPYGYSSRESNEILTDMGFLATLTCEMGINYLSGNSDELYGLKRYNRPNGVSQDEFFKQFED